MSVDEGVQAPVRSGIDAVEDDRNYVFHSWSAQDGQSHPAVAGGEGSWFWDYAGKRYLDASAQLVNANLGLQHDRVVAAVQAQAGRLCTISPHFANDVRGRLARRIVELAPPGMQRVFFTNGGTEAVEHAVRMARLHTGRAKIMSAYRSYHGATAGAITLTGDPRRWPNEPGIPGVVHFFGPHVYRSAFHARDSAQEGERALRHLDEIIRMEGPDTVAAIVLEPVVGTNGVLIPPDGYLAGVRELCDRYGIVFVADEVMVGFGRLGHWFAVDAWQVAPDLITFAKGVNSGYVPLGGVVVSREICRTFATRPYPGGLTYSGHPLACAAGLASIDVIDQTGLLARVRQVGAEVVGPALTELADRHPVVGDVRGMGLMWALELVRDRATREPLVAFNATKAESGPMNELVAALKDVGIWPFTHMNRLHVVPPLTISDDELAYLLTGLDEALTVVDRHA
ncbi:MAG: aspartate aminotransferase family protein [Kibdelosporangium sp.]